MYFNKRSQKDHRGMCRNAPVTMIGITKNRAETGNLIVMNETQFCQSCVVMCLANE